MQQADGDTKFILSFPTKDSPWESSNIDSVKEGLIYSRTIFEKLPAEYLIAVPKLGAGCGKLPSNEVIDLITSCWQLLKQDVLLYD